MVNLMDAFDTANTVDVSVTNVGSCEQNEVNIGIVIALHFFSFLSIFSFQLETVLNQGHYTNEQFATAINGMNWHGKLTAIACGVQAGLDQLDTTDNVNDVLIG